MKWVLPELLKILESRSNLESTTTQSEGSQPQGVSLDDVLTPAEGSPIATPNSPEANSTSSLLYQYHP